MTMTYLKDLRRLNSLAKQYSRLQVELCTLESDRPWSNFVHIVDKYRNDVHMRKVLSLAMCVEVMGYTDGNMVLDVNTSVSHSGILVSQYFGPEGHETLIQKVRLVLNGEIRRRLELVGEKLRRLGVEVIPPNQCADFPQAGETRMYVQAEEKKEWPDTLD